MKTKTHLLDSRGLRNASSDSHWSGMTMCGVECGGQYDVALSERGRVGASCRACLRGDKRRGNVIGVPEKLRDHDFPEVLGYALHRDSLTPARQRIDTARAGDYGADPLGDGTFRMIPSGDIVDFEERNRRLKR